MDHKRRLAGIKAGMILVVFVMLINGIAAMAANDYHLLQVGVEDGQIVAYMEGDTGVLEVQCQIGMIPCEEVAVEAMKDTPFPFHTIVLVDNSLSITQENKEKAALLLRSYIQRKDENEYMSIAVFGEEIEFLIQRSNDAQALQDALDGITHNNQDTYLTDILYDLLDTLEEGEYTRFFVLSDGVDNKAIGITKEELTEKIKENSHPIYALGHVYGKNETELENMFALSRLTGGTEFLLDETKDLEEVISQLGDTKRLMRMYAPIPKEISDGSSKNILFTVQSSAGEYELKAQIDLPFSLMEATPEPTLAPTPMPTETPAKTPEPVPEPTIEPVVEDKADNSGIVLWILILLLLAVVAVLLLKGRKGNKKAGKKQSAQEMKMVKAPGPDPAAEQPMRQAAPIPDPDMTVMLERRYLLVLKDVNDADRVFRYPLDEKVIIGRSIDKVSIAIDYNLTVSGQHCEIYARHNQFFIRDLNSSNKTCVNGRVIHEETQIISGCMIKIGEVEFSVEMLPI